MRKLTVGLAALALLAAPHMAVAQDAQDGPPPEGYVAMSSFKVPLGEERGKVMDFIERWIAPQERNNPNVLAFYVLQHNYGADSRDVVLVRVYRDWASIDAPCGEPCQTWAQANMPEQDSPEMEEMQDLWQTFMKYNGRHSDEIYSARLDLAKN